jgi:hypothetical protein
MTDTTGLPDKATVDAVLVEINKLRATKGLPPMVAILKGWAGDPHRCPIARTLDHGGVFGQNKVPRVGTVTWGYGTKSRCFDSKNVIPLAVASLREDIDHNKYPGLLL